MLCLKVIFVNCLKLIILQTTWNLSQEFDVIMPHMNIVLILCLFLIIVIILSFRQIWFHNVESSKQTVIWHRNILLYVTAVLMFIFLKCLSFKFGKSCHNCLKRLLQWIHAEFYVFLNLFSEIGYSNSKHKDTFYVPYIDWGTSVKGWFTIYLSLFWANNEIIYTFSKEFGDVYRSLANHLC